MKYQLLIKLVGRTETRIIPIDFESEHLYQDGSTALLDDDTGLVCQQLNESTDPTISKMYESLLMAVINGSFSIAIQQEEQVVVDNKEEKPQAESKDLLLADFELLYKLVESRKDIASKICALIRDKERIESMLIEEYELLHQVELELNKPEILKIVQTNNKLSSIIEEAKASEIELEIISGDIFNG